MQKILAKTNEKCEWIAKVLIIYVPVGFGISISSTAILNIIFCLIKDGTVEVESLFFPSKFAYVRNIICDFLSLLSIYHNYESKISFHWIYFSLPWNQHNILGWIVSVTIAVLNSMVLFFLNGTFLSFFVSLCECHKAFQLVFENLTEILNEKIGKNDCIEMKSAICELIKQNIIGKEWENNQIICIKVATNTHKFWCKLYFQFF